RRLKHRTAEYTARTVGRAEPAGRAGGGGWEPERAGGRPVERVQICRLTGAAWSVEHVQRLNVFKPPGGRAMYVVQTYVSYLTLSIAATIWVARTLHRNGRAFLVDAFHGHDALADSVNHLLVVGFYLVNVGWIVMTLRTNQSLLTVREAIELLS